MYMYFTMLYFRYCQQIYNYSDNKNIILFISLEKPSI